jgi:hypothetical protein
LWQRIFITCHSATGLFDAATMIRTLHHMVEPRRALEQVRRVLLRTRSLSSNLPTSAT